MRFIMALLTPWDLAVFNMAACTLQISVFGVIGLQVVINLGMTGSTDSIRHLLRVLEDIFCTVRLVAY